jgi:Mpv17 / PMP22 family
MIGLYRTSLVAATTRQPFLVTAAARRSLTKTGNTPPPTTTTAKIPETPPLVVNRGDAAASASSSSIWSFPKDHPFAFQMIVATAKTMAADLMVQTVAEGKSLSEVDWKRNGIFVVFGFAYLGGFQWYLMVNKYRQWFPTMDKFAKMSFKEKLQYPAGILDAGKMVLFDICIHLPLLYFPTYYAVKEFVGGDSWNPVDWVQDGVTKYQKNMVEDLTAMVKLWGPSDCVQFILPLHIRMPFRHLVSFFWTAYVSFTRGAIVKNVDPVAAVVE